MERWQISPEAARLHERALVWDCHGCMPLRPEPDFLPQLQRYRDAGVGAVFLNVASGDVELERLLRVLSSMRQWVRQHPDGYVLAHSVTSIRQAQTEGRLAVGFNIEGCAPLGEQLSLVESLYELGVRWMSLAYNRNNLAGGGCHDADPGLTAFGRMLIDEMFRVGMIPCCSHTGYRTALDAFTYSPGPVLFSHSNPRALCDHPRNVPDELMRACARTGGVIGINGVDIFLGPGPQVERMLRHIDYAVERIGVEHVGLGLDHAFDIDEMNAMLASARDIWPEELGYRPGIQILEPEGLPELTEGLLKLGYAEADVRCILGENFMRVAAQVWK